MKKGDNSSQLFTFAEIVRNNAKIFSKRYERGWNENTNHYVCKIFLGEQIKKHYPKMEIVYEYDGLPNLGTADDPRHYLPDIFCFYRNLKNKVIQIADIEIDGLIHKASKHQYNKSKWRRESITDYFENYIDKTFENFPIVFSYLVFEPQDFLYNKLDFFLNIFDDKFKKGGIYPEKSAYEINFL